MLRQLKMSVERVMTPPIEIDPQIEEIAATAVRQNWSAPLQLILEAGRPLAFIAGQLLWLAQPTLALFWSPTAVARWAAALEEPDKLDQLLARLEEAQS
jgi:hypothetical protein